jgi:hypothetical protein
MHLDDMARTDPRQVDSADGADAAVVGGQRKAQVEDLND